MEGTRRLKGWQMGVIVALLVALLSTMFMPAFHFNSEVVGKMYDYLVDNSKTFSIIDSIIDAIDKELSDDAKEKYFDDFKESKKEDGIEVFDSVTPFKIMTNDYVGFITTDDATDEDIDKIKDEDNYSKKKQLYNSIRIPLIIVYVFAVVVMLIIIIGFAARWSKYPTVIITLVYSIIAAIMFGYLRFIFLSHLGKKFFEMIEDFINELAFDGLGLIDISDKVGKLLTSMYSVSFLIAFIISILIVVMGIVSLVVGNSEQVLDYEREYNYGGDSFVDNGMGGGFDSEFGATTAFDNNINPFGENGIGGGAGQMAGGDVFGFGNMNGAADSIAVTEAADEIFADNKSVGNQYNNKRQSSVQQNVQQAGAMGTVRCTKGIAFGQGFQLPENKKVVVGKSPAKTNLTVNHPNVSNIHCSIRYNASRNTYIVKDHSTNGTFVGGNRLPKDVALEYPAGTVLVLADGANEITLG